MKLLGIDKSSSKSMTVIALANGSKICCIPEGAEYKVTRGERSNFIEFACQCPLCKQVYIHRFDMRVDKTPSQYTDDGFLARVCEECKIV